MLLVAAGFAVLAGGLGYLVGNEVQARTQFDEARRSLEARQGQIRAVVAQLRSVEADLHDVNGQVSDDTAALSSDVTQLRSTQGELATTQADVTRQATDRADLRACLGGVQQALNAISVGDRPVALAVLGGVTAACQRAVAADG
jgi:hypothetical protein